MNELEHILRLCKKGDEKAQRYLYAQVKSKWMGLAVRYMKDADAAKDVFQEAVLKIFADLKKLKDESAFNGWARRIVINTALNHLRQRQGYLIAVQGHFEDRGETFEESEDTAIQSMDSEWILALIADMPDGYRMVFNLFIIDGYSHKEIGEKLNISESTSRSQLAKAKQYFKKALMKSKKNCDEKAVGY